jgi:hypothetical protein
LLLQEPIRGGGVGRVPGEGSAAFFDASLRMRKNVARFEGGPPYISPAKRPPEEQAKLAERIRVARRHRKSWDEIAEAEGIPKRTLQHFAQRARERRSASPEREGTLAVMLRVWRERHPEASGGEDRHSS